jgi:hypothetical protein
VTATLPIDLDNTLLDNDMETFLPAYMQALTHLAPYADPPVMTRVFWPPQRMVENTRLIDIDRSFQQCLLPGA